MALTALHWEATPPGVRDAYEALSSVPAVRESSYLAGGTALALLEAHRVSADLDLFTSELGDPLALAGQLREVTGEVEVLSTGPAHCT